MSIERALAALRNGGIVVVVDDEDREDEGDLVMAAQYADTESVAFFLHHTSGFLCTAITPERAGQLRLPAMVQDNTEKHGTAFLVSVDYMKGTTTGISAHDRAATVRALADPGEGAGAFARPGHVLPLRTRVGGVFKRAGHTEASADLCAMAGLEPAALLCELVSKDCRTMMARDDIREFATEHGLPLVSIANLLKHRRMMSRIVERVGEAEIPTGLTDFRAIAFRSIADDTEHLALVCGEIGDGRDVLVRVHSECLTGDVMGSQRCDCGLQLQFALNKIAGAGRGVVVYLRGHEGRGIGLGHKLRAYQLQEAGLDTVDANIELNMPVDSREYGVGAQILVDLGVREAVLMTNNPHKYRGLAGHSLQITGRVPINTPPTSHNVGYLSTKRKRLGHDIDLEYREPS